jgi:hypothetical protein
MESRILVVMGILAIVLVAGCTTTGNVASDEPVDETPYADCDSCCSEGKAMLDLGLLDWGNYLDRFYELFFSVEVYNYGYVEAKNVLVRCEIYNDVDDASPVFVAERALGNIASTSVKSRELVFDRDDVFIDDEAVWSCEIASCENCEVLKERIPELDE